MLPHVAAIGKRHPIRKHVRVTSDEAKAYEPRVVHLDEHNRVRHLGNDPGEGVDTWARTTGRVPLKPPGP